MKIPPCLQVASIHPAREAMPEFLQKICVSPFPGMQRIAR